MKTDEKLDKIFDILVEMRVDVAKNTVDLAHHIKRSDMLEAKMQKIIYLLAIGAGIGITLYGPDALKLLKVVL